MEAVEVVGLSKVYPAPFRLLRRRTAGPRAALADVQLSIRPGEIVGLMGPNGAGKSTLLRILAGLLLPTSGSARVGGLDVTRARPRCRRLVGAALSDDRGLNGRLTARENLSFFASLYGLAARERSARIEALAERLEAVPLLDRPVRSLSGGEKARIVLARTLLHRPPVVLLDELTRSLDPGAAARIRRHIRDELAGSGAAVLLASHDLQELEALADRVVLLSGGRAVASGRYEDVRPLADAVFGLPTKEAA